MVYRNKPVRENRIEQRLIAGVKAAFPTGQVHKYEVRKGEPDRLLLLPGPRTVFVEVKRPGEKPRADQYRALKRLRRLGYEAYWFSTNAEVDDFIKMLVLTQPEESLL